MHAFKGHTLSLFLGELLLDAVQEIAELPPPYVPALFGVALLVGVGLLTGSLGNVMDEESLVSIPI